MLKHEKNIIQIILLASISAIVSGAFYYYRTTYMDLTSVEHSIFRAVRMGIVYIVFPFGWALYFKKFRLKDMGITTKNLLYSIIFGTAVYSIALAVFIYTVGNEDFDVYFVDWMLESSQRELIIILALTSFMAVVTDVWTRGFILMLLARHHSPYLGVLAQNVTWLLVHLYEIDLLQKSLSLHGAITLTLTLGLSGDALALKTRNIIGLAVGHVFLNIAFACYIMSIA